MAGNRVGGRRGLTRAGACCPRYHEAVELVGRRWTGGLPRVLWGGAVWAVRRWTGAILRVLMGGPMRFSEIGQSVPELSDRLLSERMKELEARGIVERRVIPGAPVGVEYRLWRVG